MLKDFVSNYTVKRSYTSVDEYGQQEKNNWRIISKDVPIAVGPQTEANFGNNPLLVKVTHMGVCKSDFQDFKKNDLLVRSDQTLEITMVVFGRNKAILFLKEV